ncbi:MAG: serpin family protein [Oscillospiraceae bacterium]|nr:serpin family protein [Oscillospiraceae bacterium]
MKRFIALCAAGAMLLSLCACGSGNAGGNAKAETLSAENSVMYPEAIDYNDWESSQANRDENAVSAGFADALQLFACRSTENVIASADKNVCYSPVSLYFALALAAYGADGNTAEQLYSALGVKDKEELAEQCGKLFRLLYTDDGLDSLFLANSLWMNKDITFKDDYLNDAAEDFYASLFSVDFSDASAGEQMSQWVSDNTSGLLKPKVEVKPEELMHIFNTVYFYSQWQKQFEESATDKDTFTLADGSTVDCDFMRISDEGSEYTKGVTPWGAGYTVARRALKSGDMFFILPDKGVELTDVLNSATTDLNEPYLKTLLADTDESSATIKWSIPKFSTDSTLDLVSLMQDMGVKDAFTDSADFSGISDTPSFISAIAQGTHIKLEETGVEAAAYTEVTMGTTSVIVDNETIEMNLDRPFIYGVESEDGTLLFVGVCANPAE